jgi:hypothetical protein
METHDEFHSLEIDYLIFLTARTLVHPLSTVDTSGPGRLSQGEIAFPPRREDRVYPTKPDTFSGPVWSDGVSIDSNGCHPSGEGLDPELRRFLPGELQILLSQ